MIHNTASEVGDVKQASLAGSFDHFPPALQLRAVDITLSHYFGKADWLKARNQLMPGLRS